MATPNEERTIGTENAAGGGGSSHGNTVDSSCSSSKTISKSDSFSYVTYGMLQKNHEFVDWVRVDLEEDDMVNVLNSSNGNNTTAKDVDGSAASSESSSIAAVAATRSSTSIDAFKDMDERAFELFKTQWQEISASDPNESVDSETTITSAFGNNNNSSNDSSTVSFVEDPIGMGKRLLASTNAPKPDSVSYGIFDENWNIVKLSPRHSNVDMAILLHAASEAGKENSNENDGDDDGNGNKTDNNTNNKNQNKKESLHNKRTYLKDPLAGKEKELTIVPIRRSSQQQFWIKKSVQFFFRKESISFFACFPLRFSPRTIYRFDMVHGEVGRNFWHQRKADEQQQRSSISSPHNAATKPNENFLRNSLASKMSTTRDSFWKDLARKPSTDSREETGGSNSATANDGSSNMVLDEVRSKMASNAASMRNTFAARVSTTKESFLNLSSINKNKGNHRKDSGNVDDSRNKNTNIDNTMPDKLSQMKQRMSENTTNMRNSFASKVLATKQSFLNLKIQTHSDSNSNIKKSANKQSTVASGGVLNDEGSGQSAAPMSPTVSSGTDSNPSNIDKSTPAGYFALTIDDVPCRFDDRSHSHLESVLDLLKKHDAKATFMVISSFLADCHRADMIRLLKEGHELANHGVRDEPMHKTATSVEAFLRDLDECNARITDLQAEAGTTPIGVRWFRAPQSRYTVIMEEGLAKRDMYNVMCDAYAACPIVEDGPWIASALGKQIQNGSIAILHMPERCGFREYCLEAMEGLLEDLCNRRNFKAVTVSELERLSWELKAVGTGSQGNDKR